MCAPLPSSPRSPRGAAGAAQGPAAQTLHIPVAPPGCGLQRQAERRSDPSPSRHPSPRGSCRRRRSAVLPLRHQPCGTARAPRQSPRQPPEHRGQQRAGMSEMCRPRRCGRGGGAGTPLRRAGRTGTGQSLAQSGVLLPRMLPQPQHSRAAAQALGPLGGAALSAQHSCQGLQNSCFQLCSPRPGLRLTRRVLTFHCALTKALYPQAKTSTLSHHQVKHYCDHNNYQTIFFLLLLLLRTQIKLPTVPVLTRSGPWGKRHPLAYEQDVLSPRG